MIEVYTFQGKDTTSDSGHWYIVVQGENKSVAYDNAEQYLYDIGRTDLISSLAASIVARSRTTRDIIFSNVELPNGQRGVNPEG